MSPKFRADFFDGRTAQKQAVAVAVSEKGLHIALASEGDVLWTFEKIRLQKIGDSRHNLRLEHDVEGDKGRCTETLIVSDPEFSEQIIAWAPPEFSAPARPSSWKRKAGFCLGALLIPFVLYGLWIWAIPSITMGLASQVPVAWEEKLGDVVLESIAPAKNRKNAPQTQKALESIVTRLLKSDPDQPYEIKIHIQSGSMVNAFALPGGHIIVFQGLLQETDSIEEIAGILAHELQHVLRRHTTQAIIQSVSTYLIFSTLTGDVTGAMQTVLDTAANLGHLSINRNMESEADKEGMLMILNSGVNPEGMISAFKKLDKHSRGDKNQDSIEGQEEDDSVNNVLEYFSTHPLGEARVKSLQGLAMERKKETYPPLLPDLDWKKMIDLEFPKPENKKVLI